MSGPVRPVEVQNFIDTTLAVMADLVTTPKARRAVAGIRAAAQRVVAPGVRAPRRQPACRHLDAAFSNAASDPRLAPVVAALREAEPLLEWEAEADGDAGPEGYADLTILGPGGYEERGDIWLGVSLLAPHIRYPDHNHAPEEVYLALSSGDFYREGSGWFTPGIGGTFYNQPSIRHAMRSGDAPLFAIWALRRV